MISEKLVLVAALGVGVAGFAAACGNGAGDDEAGHHGEARPEECQAIVDACHEKDVGDPGPINDCHSVGHAGERDECVRVGGDPSFDGKTCPQVCVEAPLPTG